VKWVVDRLRLLGALLGSMALALAGCGSQAASTSTSTTVAQGVIAGVAAPCIGRSITASQLANVSVTVRVSANAKTVETQTVTGEPFAYRFVVAPGLYEVSSGGEGSLEPLSVAVRSGEVVRVNVPSNCL